jgi:hypothetical protein
LLHSCTEQNREEQREISTIQIYLQHDKEIGKELSQSLFRQTDLKRSASDHATHVSREKKEKRKTILLLRDKQIVYPLVFL